MMRAGGQQATAIACEWSMSACLRVTHCMFPFLWRIREALWLQGVQSYRHSAAGAGSCTVLPCPWITGHLKDSPCQILKPLLLAASKLHLSSILKPPLSRCIHSRPCRRSLLCLPPPPAFPAPVPSAEWPERCRDLCASVQLAGVSGRSCGAGRQAGQGPGAHGDSGRVCGQVGVAHWAGQGL